MTAEIKPGVRYRMPAVFGPAPGPRQKADGTPWKPEETGTMNGHWLTVGYRTHAGQLAKLLPPGFALRGELAIARAFAASGAGVHVCDVDSTALARLGSEPVRITSTQCDVADRFAVQSMVSEAIQTLGGLDVLINNAGIAGPTGRVDQIPPEDWDRTIAVNLTGHFNVTRLAIAELAKGQRSSIMCISSVAGRLAFPNRSAYAASKWAVVGFMKTLSAELGALGIRVNAILPGMVDGPRLQSVLEAKALEAGLTKEDILQRGLAGLSIKSLVPSEKVASTAVFLASQAAAAISGQALSVDNDAHYMA